MKMEEQPLYKVEWVNPEELHANDYNPNRVFGPELKLLKISIMEDGWTQPIVRLSDNTIVDGFHRYTLGLTDPDIREMTGGRVPVVTVQLRDETHRKMSTIRHNRARGKHGVLKMGEIIRSMVGEGYTKAEVCKRLQMEGEEFDRLTELRGSPSTAGKESFGKGWVPDRPKTPEEILAQEKEEREKKRLAKEERELKKKLDKKTSKKARK